MNTEQIGELLEKVRDHNPLVHNITNVVVTNFTANGLLSLGASPVMAHAAEEVADMAKIAGTLVLNIGTLDEAKVNSMLIAGRAANAHGIPIIFDPVGAGATPYRTETARKIMNDLNISVIRGNAAEIANVAGQHSEIKGVDAIGDHGHNEELAESAARKLDTVTVITGKHDVISDGKITFIVKNGVSLLTKVTGAGCLLTSIIGAFHAVETSSMRSAVSALAVYGVAAELAERASAGKGPGTFQIELLNSLNKVTAANIEELGIIEQRRISTWG